MKIQELRLGYMTGKLDPVTVIEACYEKIATVSKRQNIWIHLVPREEAIAAARALSESSLTPLWGIPFAVKDNMDVAGMPTSAACPEYRYIAKESAAVVQRLLDAGAILIGKTNMDQFATGLVGVRSPYGECRSVFDEEYISGGSSSGSAVAVALELAAFSLGTDTAGSGRVPAAFNNLIGFKPTRGYLSCAGVVPACRSLDCVSVFAHSAEDAADVLAIAGAPDRQDPYSRMAVPRSFPRQVRVGFPAQKNLEFFGDAEAAKLFEQAVDSVRWHGAELIEVNVGSFIETAKLLYGGPFVAERLSATQVLLRENPDALLPVLREILTGAERWTATDAFEAMAQLSEIKKVTNSVWDSIDILLLPTTGTIYKSEEVNADPIRLNSNLGYYTNFVNLLDLCAVATPAGFRSSGLPFGVQWIAPAWTDSALLNWAGEWMRAQARSVELAVVGAHLRGQPLHWQIEECGGVFVSQCRTAANYRLLELQGTQPRKPGLVRVGEGEGAAIEVEVYRFPEQGFGAFVAKVPPPLAIGTLILENGAAVKGFLCEQIAAQAGKDITEFGGWRAWLTQSEL